MRERGGWVFFYRYLKNVNRLLTSFTFNSDGVYENINIGTCRKKIALCSRNQNSLTENVFIKNGLGGF